MRKALPLLLVLATVAATRTAGAQALAGYFGPVRATVGFNSELPLPGTPYSSPGNYAHLSWENPDPQGAPLFVDACVVLLDSYGPSLGDGFVELDTQRTYTALHSAWQVAHGFNMPWFPQSPLTCDFLLARGSCVVASGRVLASPDVLGRTYVVDAVSYCP